MIIKEAIIILLDLKRFRMQLLHKNYLNIKCSSSYLILTHLFWMF